MFAEVHQAQFGRDFLKECEPFGVLVPVLGGDLLRLEDHRAPEGAVDVQDLGLQQRPVNRRIEFELGHAGTEPVDVHERLGPHRGDRHPVVQLLGYVREEPLVAGDHDFLGPGLGEDAQQSEFEGQGIGVLPGAFDRGVDAADKGRDDLVPVRVVPAHLLPHVLPEHVESDSDVPLEFRRPENGRDRSRRLPPPHLELEQAVLGGAVALDEEQVFLAVGVDVVEPPAVGEDFGRGAQAVHLAGFVLGRSGGGEEAADGQQQGNAKGTKTHGRTPWVGDPRGAVARTR